MKWIPYIREELSDKYYFITFTPSTPGNGHEARDILVKNPNLTSLKSNSYISSGIPVLWTGDFNASLETAEIQNIINSGYEPTCNYGEHETTYHGWNYDENFFSEIDFIFVRDNSVIVKDYEVFNEMVNGDYASDHHPVISNVYVP